jgi:hypothetical protein
VFGLRGFFRSSSAAEKTRPRALPPAGGPVARHGRSFRTVKMRLPEQGEAAGGEWLLAEAAEDGRRWRVCKCAPPALHMADGVIRQDVVRCALYRDGLDFFGALALLAEYEVGQLRLGWRALEGEEALGFRHYRAFGCREGVAFDVAGQPLRPRAAEEEAQAPPAGAIPAQADGALVSAFIAGLPEAGPEGVAEEIGRLLDAQRRRGQAESRGRPGGAWLLGSGSASGGPR